MSAVSETSISLLASTFPPLTTVTATKIVGGILLLVLGAATLHYASPARLTRVLLTAMHDTKTTYFDALDTGIISSSNDNGIAERLSALEIEASTIHETTLHNSLSVRAALRDFLKGRTFDLLQCIHRVRQLHTHIEILKESQLRDPNPLLAMRALSLRRRYPTPASRKFCRCPA
ncbi:hypothetical protein C8R43DRAFT_1018311 [Mycena crocata]|nr:hypothetical protein C8R43DRAFT_1018311 [Mycena crocata]